MGADWVAIRARFRAECAEIVAPPPLQVPVEPSEPPSLFYIGIPCKHGHGGRRYRSTHSCVLCTQAAQVARRAHEDVKPSVAEERLSLMAIYYEQDFDRAGWRRAHEPGHRSEW